MKTTTATEPRIIHRLNVWELPDGSHESEGVRLVQSDIGKVRGGGTCPDPFRIELTPLYEAAPDLLEACRELLAQVTGPAMIYGDGRGNDGQKTGLSHSEFNALHDRRIELARAAIAKATASTKENARA